MPSSNDIHEDRMEALYATLDRWTEYLLAVEADEACTEDEAEDA